MMKICRIAFVLSMALWVGGLATISFVVAPTAFKTAPNPHDAGSIVGASLRAFGKVEVACGAIALAASLGMYARRPEGSREGFVRAILVFLMLVITLSYVGWVYPEVATARFKMGHMPNDPTVKEYFAMMHRVSVILVAANILVGTGLLVCAGLKSKDGA